jgi:hypothetical protein
MNLPSVEDQKPYTMTSAERRALFDTPLSNPKRAVFFTVVTIIAAALQQSLYLIILQLTTFRCHKLSDYKFY